jgi:prepilin-type N-terminal cleavage/methylation domain-containing protein/prepilin-type processing-associated H-X9-DG protein
MRKAFTLIELLVVIAIIALLMGILMPALNRAREMGKRAGCMNNMRQVGIAMQMYANENRKLPPKQHPAPNFNHPDAPKNVLKLLIPFIGGGNSQMMSPKVYNCPSLKPHPSQIFAPTEYSSTGLSANTVPLGNPLVSIRRAADIIVLQEAWSLSHQLWNQPEPVDRTAAALEGRAKNTYRQWHMWAKKSMHPSYLTSDYSEHLSNVHDDGGSLVFADGHAEYRKYQNLKSSDFGLVNMSGNVENYESTDKQSVATWKPQF